MTTTLESFLKLLKKCRFSGLMVKDGERHYHIHGGTTTPRWQLILTATEEKKPTEPLELKQKAFGEKQRELWLKEVVPFCEKAVEETSSLIVVEGPSGFVVFKPPHCEFGHLEEYYARVPSPPKETQRQNKKRSSRAALKIEEGCGDTFVRNPSAKMRKCIQIKGWHAEYPSVDTVCLKGVIGVTNEIKGWQTDIENKKVPTIVVATKTSAVADALVATQDME